MEKRITIRGIAKQAGVSTATVSYVLNNRKDQKISPSVRKKILQLANLYHYSVNVAAKSLATGRPNSVAIVISQPSTLLGQANAYLLLTELSNKLTAKGLRVSFVPLLEPARIDGVDGIFCWGLSTSQFDALGEENFVPLIAIDALVDNPWLFYEVTDSFKGEEGKHDLIVIPSSSQGFEAYLKSKFKVREATDLKSLEAARKASGTNLFIRDPALRGILVDEKAKFTYLDPVSDKKVAALMESLAKANSYDQVSTESLHRIRV